MDARPSGGGARRADPGPGAVRRAAGHVEVLLRHAPRSVALRPLDGAAALAWREAETRGLPPAVLMTRLLTTQAGMDPAASRALTLGDRERLALAIFTEAFGPELELLVACASCGATMEVALDPAALCPPPSPGVPACRLPNGAAAEMAAAADDPGATLLAWCGGGDRARVTAEVARYDPEADCLLDLDCEACGARVSVAVDAAGLLSARLPARSHLLDAVDQLARRYGWTEPATLAVPLSRLPAYLALVDGAA